MGNDHTNDVVFFFCLTENATNKIILPKENIEKKLNKVLQGKKKKDLTLLINMSLINRDRGEKGKGLGKNGGRMGGGAPANNSPVIQTWQFFFVSLTMSKMKDN